jgi:hypothetical protein
MPSLFQRAAVPGGLALAAALATVVVGGAGLHGDALWSPADDRELTGSIASACRGKVDTGFPARTCADASTCRGKVDTGFPARTSADANQAVRLPLSEEQRGHIFDGIMKVRDAPVADVAVPQPARTLPSSVELQDLPPSVTHDVPVVQGYKFVKLDDRVLLVSPLDRTVVAELPRYRLIVD